MALVPQEIEDRIAALEEKVALLEEALAPVELEIEPAEFGNPFVAEEIEDVNSNIG